MSLLDTIFEVIDLRSFSNLWFWIALAAIWALASHFVLGVPFDLVARAERRGGQARDDLTDLARVQITRLLEYTTTGGVLLAALAGFVFSALLLLAFFYRIEFAQALLFILVPMAIILAMSHRAALAIVAADPDAGELIRHLKRHRLRVQILGMVSIFFTAMWGMWVNISGASWY